MLVIVFWTVAASIMVVYHYIESKKLMETLARDHAADSIEKDVEYRYWAVQHSSLYVPITEKTPPNPYLSHIKERDITTPSGRRLTLMNPAYMTRQVQDIARERTGIQRHITSNRPIRPENRPDAWEEKALREIESGKLKDYSEIVLIDGARNFRLMVPLTVERPCLSCHASQGYKLGDMRGGISASVPMAMYETSQHNHMLSEIRNFVPLWALGIAGIILSAPLVHKRINETLAWESKLATSEERYRNIVDTAMEGIVVINKQDIITFTNSRMAEMLGYAQDEMPGKSIFAFISDDDREDHKYQLTLRRQGIATQYERRFLRNDGVVIWTRASASPLLDEQGRYQGAFGMFTDVSENKRSESIHAETTRRLHLATSAAKLGVWDWNVRDNVMVWDGRMFELYGLGRDKFTNSVTIWENSLHPDDRTRAIAESDAAIRGERELDTEFRVLHPDGSVRHIKADAITMRDNDGKALRMIGLNQDITERRLAEVALRENEKRYRELFDSINNCVAVYEAVDCGRDFIVKDINKAAEKLEHVMREDVLGKKVTELFPDIVDSGLMDVFLRVWRSGLSEHQQLSSVSNDHIAQWRKNYVYRLPTGEVVVIYEDITHQMLAEEERKQLESQLLQAQKIESVGRLAGGIAHDINNMITPILGYAEILEQKIPSGDSRRDDLAEISGAAIRVRDMTRQLLAFARKQTLEMSQLDLNEVVSGIIRVLRMTIHENIAIDVRLAPTVRSVMGDKSQFEQVIMNLVVNAQDAMPSGGTFTLATQDVVVDGTYAASQPGMAPGNYVRLIAIDTGTGMDTEIKSKIFDPFFTTKEVGRGTGLGLATVYGIVKQHGGYIEVKSEPGMGSEFIVSFPVNEAPAETAAKSAHEQQSQRGTEMVLIVEDQEQVLRLVSMMLTNSGYRVLIAQSGREALRIAESFTGDIHLVISDVIMPDMNGKVLFERLREVRQNLQIIYMSGYPADVIGLQGVLHSGINFIRKPFSIHELTSAIRKVLDRRGT